MSFNLSDRSLLKQNVGQLSLNGHRWQRFTFDSYTNKLTNSKTVFLKLKKGFSGYGKGSVLKVGLRNGQPTIC
jgi:hypothetical protein